MDVTTVGGGPGGLYASLQLKRRHPDWSVTVHERNPPDVTYGFGIVFPDRGLSRLAEADPETHAAITEAFTAWEPFDIHYRGERYRCGGHRFASLMRTDLLRILGERCRAVGVELEYGTEVTDPARRAAETDLLIGADGIHSATRAAFADAFGTETVEGEARFSWFGTDRQFEALSHVFVENDDGIWCAHTYPGPTSTFIVDCDAETWANAGLADRAEADTLAYLEETFADSLDGHPLRSERDRWRTFTTVTNERWHHDGVVLLGDAAHTAHYSIGSGTTLALEDALGLADAFDGFDGGLEVALDDYERRRQSFVEPLQAAGERSRRHFEAIRRFYGTPGPRFAIHHLTRSGRLTYSSLRARDPGFVDRADRWFLANETPIDPRAAADDLAPADRPLSVRGTTLPNRFVGVGEPSSDGVVELACAGFGLAVTAPLGVSTDGPSPVAGADPVDPWADAVERARDGGEAALGVQLGAYAAPDASDGGPRGLDRGGGRQTAPPEPVGPSAREPEVLRSAFVEAAGRAAEAGFDLLLLDAGPASALGAFRSPSTNDRAEASGAGSAGRDRLLGEVVAAVRRAWPDHRPLGVTLQADDWRAGGLTLEDAIGTVQGLADRGVDLVAPVAGGPGTERPHPNADPAWYSDHLRHATGVRTLATGAAVERDAVDTLVGTGRADASVFAGAPPG